MGKYKDEDTIIKALHNHHFITEVNGADWFDQIMNQVVDEIKNVPAADVVEVVRCKDCTMYRRDRELAEANYCDPNFYCGLLRTEMNENGFCSYGKRKDG